MALADVLGPLCRDLLCEVLVPFPALFDLVECLGPALVAVVARVARLGILRELRGIHDGLAVLALEAILLATCGVRGLADWQTIGELHV